MLVGVEWFERLELRGKQRWGHEMSRPAGLSATDDLCRSAQVQNHQVGAVPPELVTVLALQRRAAHHAAVMVVSEPLPDGLQPWVAVIVVEGVTRGHLRDVGRRVEVVGVGERHP